MDKKIESHIRPKYIELLKMSTPENFDEVAKRYFAGKEIRLRKEKSTKVVNRSEFWTNFGIKIEDYAGYFAEVGGTSAIRGASFPTEKIRPIFTIQMSNSGKTWKVVVKTCPGFMSNDLSRAWIEVDLFEKMLGDTFFTELEERQNKIAELNKRAAQKSQKQFPHE